MSRWLRVAINMNSLIGKEVEAVDSTNKEILSAWKGKPALFDVVENHVVLHFARGDGGTSTVQSIKKTRDGFLEVKTKNSVYKFEILSSENLLKKEIDTLASYLNQYSLTHHYEGENAEQEKQKAANDFAENIVNNFYRKFHYSDELISKILDGVRPIVYNYGMLMSQVPYSFLCDAIENLL